MLNILTTKLLQGIKTPAFVLNEKSITQQIAVAKSIRAETNCKMLYALKPLVNVDALKLMSKHLNGFAASSLYEAKIAREAIGNKGTVHITTPGFRSDEMGQLAKLCDYVAFNSLSQMQRFQDSLYGKTHCGIRINPQLSFVEDVRYNPCRDHSKLGVPLDQLLAELEHNPRLLNKMTGIHFHSNCDCMNLNHLLRTVKYIDKKLGNIIAQMQWINLGGGYIFDESTDLRPAFTAINWLKSRYDVDIFLEPGATFVRKAGYLVTSVIDLFANNGATIALLDTSVNHMPEVFEYQFEPEVVGDKSHGHYEYILAGSTCLAGDIFGEYAFNKPLKIGTKIIFKDVGAYTQVKAHMFNGLNLPALYLLNKSGELRLRKRFSYQDFLSRVG